LLTNQPTTLRQHETNLECVALKLDHDYELKMMYRDFCGSQEFDFVKQYQQQQQQQKPAASNRNASSSVVKNADSQTSSQIGTSSSSSSFASETQQNTDQSQNNKSNKEKMPTTGSLISDYRLSLTDFIDLNLIDVSNGMLINPLTGQRLSINDALRIDLLNTDIKEIANTFYLNSPPTTVLSSSILTTSLKLTVKEAIKLGVLNPSKNELYLSAINPNLKLNLYQAKKQNLILKPLTLSEAFLRNLIQPNGFVRNPINNKFYAFESIVLNDLVDNKSNQNLSSQLLYLFDFDTKHIIDPNDTEKRLLSLSEAIKNGLIIPRTFELNLNSKINNPPIKTRNLYDVFSNSTKYNLGLLVYKPELENVYIKLIINQNRNKNNDQNNNNNNNNNDNNKFLTILMSKRDKIGLQEALNLNCLNLKSKTYKLFSNENNENNEKEAFLSLDEATFRFNLIDRDLILLLNQESGFENLSIMDCLNSQLLSLEKSSFRNPFTNEILQLDSASCRALLGDQNVKKMKKLITRIIIKSYIISTPVNTTAKSSLINFKQPNVVHNKPIIDHRSNSEEDDSNSTNLTGISSGKVNLIKETKSYILDHVVLPQNNDQKKNRISIGEARRRGILDLEQGLFNDMFRNLTISIEEAIKIGLIEARMATCEKNLIKNSEKDEQDKNNSNRNSRDMESRKSTSGQETTTLTIESVLDAKTGKRLSISDAIKFGILDQSTLSYKNAITNKSISLNEAYESGFVKGSLCSSINPHQPKNISPEKHTTMPAELQPPRPPPAEKCFKINSVYDPIEKKFVNLPTAIKNGLFNKTKGVYVNKLNGQEMVLSEAHKLGLIKVDPIQKPQDNNPPPAPHSTIPSTTQSLVSKKIERIEQVLTDEDDLTDSELDDKGSEKNNFNRSSPSKVRLRRSFRAGIRNGSGGKIGPIILERRIPSQLYDGQNAARLITNQPHETLVIDDVRQSRMLNIDGVNQLIKNEVSIDEPDQYSKNKKSVIQIDSSPVTPRLRKNREQSKERNNLNNSENNSASSNRTLVLIDNVIKKCEPIETSISDHNNNVNNNTPLRIHVNSIRDDLVSATTHFKTIESNNNRSKQNSVSYSLF
jgi:hypothetical protein